MLIDYIALQNQFNDKCQRTASPHTFFVNRVKCSFQLCRKKTMVN